MRIGELSARTGVPVPTIKFYLREGLLPAGERTSATQARYDDRHVERLTLVRVLIESARLSIAQVRRVVTLLDDPPADTLELLAGVQEAVAEPVPAVDEGPARALLAGWGWSVDPSCDGQVAVLAAALDAVRTAGFEMPTGMLDRYGQAMRDVARAEIAAMPIDSAQAAVRYTILGAMLFEPVLLALRRLAEADAVMARFADAAPQSEPG